MIVNKNKQVDLSVGVTIAKSKTYFKIIDLFEDLYLCEQTEVINNKSYNIVAYEVGKLIKSKLGKYLKTIPSATTFGNNTIDKSFTKNRKAEALTYFDSFKK